RRPDQGDDEHREPEPDRRAQPRERPSPVELPDAVGQLRTFARTAHRRDATQPVAVASPARQPWAASPPASSAVSIRLSATWRYEPSTSSATSDQSTGAASNSSSSHPPGPK